MPYNTLVWLALLGPTTNEVTPSLCVSTGIVWCTVPGPLGLSANSSTGAFSLSAPIWLYSSRLACLLAKCRGFLSQCPLRLYSSHLVSKPETTHKRIWPLPLNKQVFSVYPNLYRAVFCDTLTSQTWRVPLPSKGSYMHWKSTPAVLLSFSTYRQNWFSINVPSAPKS